MKDIKPKTIKKSDIWEALGFADPEKIIESRKWHINHKFRQNRTIFYEVILTEEFMQKSL
jgi:hypothetical protein